MKQFGDIVITDREIKTASGSYPFNSQTAVWISEAVPAYHYLIWAGCILVGDFLWFTESGWFFFFLLILGCFTLFGGCNGQFYVNVGTSGGRRIVKTFSYYLWTRNESLGAASALKNAISETINSVS